MAAPKIIVDSPLGPDAFTLRHMSGQEELGGLFHWDLELLSTRRNVVLRDVLGKDMTVHLDLPAGQTRYFHGFVSELSMLGGVGRHAQYRVVLRPWLWFLTRTSNSRIFQELTVPDILKQVLRERGLTDVEDALTGSYASFEYVVQYRESDFNFLSRLMEQEGIYFFFKHEAGKHTLVLADGHSAHQATPGYADVPYYPPDARARRERECVDGWQLQQTVQPGTYSLDDYDFKRPRADLQTKLSAPRSHEHDDYEVYDYPGKYVAASEGENYVKIRLEELHRDFERTSGQGNARGMAVGALFALSGHPNEDQNAEYLVTAASYELHAGEIESMAGGDDDEPTFRVSFAALKSDIPFRSARSTPRPVVHGPQTAMVVGKSGEEIWTDEHGRVKVRFHWDRADTAGESSSCWVRVSQAWAGAGWGSMHVPRIGQEVVVSFLEGDPDRPLITGRVYNGSNKAPFGLPGSAMISGFKSDSTPGGGGYNELSFDDTKGAEMVTIHGQFDMATTVEHDQTLTVHNNRTCSIDVDDTETVGANQTISIGSNQSQTVGADQTENIGSNQTLMVGADQVTTVGGNRAITVAANQTVTVGISSEETVGVDRSLTVGASYDVSVGAGMSETIMSDKVEKIVGAKNVDVGGALAEVVVGAKTVSVGGALSVTSAKDASHSASGNFSISAGKKGVIEIADELTIKVGSAMIQLKKNGDITIKGKDVKVNASGDLTQKGSKIKQN